MKSIYNSSDNTLQERAEMEKPEPKDYYSQGVSGDWSFLGSAYRTAYKSYQKHLASLRLIPCHDSCRGLWVEGQILEEGKDYEVKLHYHAPDDKETTAFPLVPVKSEDDLLTVWEQAQELDVFTDFKKWFDQKYALTKKQ